MATLRIDTPRVFAPLLQDARYKGAWGGRGSGKSHFFAELMVEDSLRLPGLRSVCIREVQKDLKDSAKLLIEDKINRLGLASQFDVQRDLIVTPGGGQIIFRGMQDYNSESIKSLEGFDRAWIEEAHTLSERSLTLLRPTIRKEGSQIWASWNPRRKTDAVDAFLRANPPEGSIVVRANWNDNPFFPATLEDERRHDLKHYPDRYPNVWDGEYAAAVEGAYFAPHLAAAKREGRIGPVARDPLLPVRFYCDIGGTSGRSDAFAGWVVQFAGLQVRVLDYYEAVGQEFGEHVAWLRKRGWDGAEVVLPHDGLKHDTVVRVTPESFFRDAGFRVRSMPNMGAGAASARIEAVRRLFPSIWFNEATTEPGREALGFYHEKKDDARNVGLGPEHDWSSHGSDAFGLMATDHQPPKRSQPINYSSRGIA